MLAELVGLAAPDPALRAALITEVRTREAAFPTALGDGIALPHARTAHVDGVRLAAGVMRSPIPFGAADGNPVDLFFLVLSPANAPSEHLKVLRVLSRMFTDRAAVSALREATGVAAFLSVIRGTPAF